MCSLLRKRTNGVSVKEKKVRLGVGGGGYDKDKNGERLPQRPTSLATIHQSGMKIFWRCIVLMYLPTEKQTCAIQFSLT